MKRVYNRRSLEEEGFMDGFPFTSTENLGRLDVVLEPYFVNLSRHHIQQLIKKGQVLVNGSESKCSHKVKKGDVVDVKSIQNDPMTDPVPFSVDLPKPSILYEDEAIIVLNKAPGVICHPGSGTKNKPTLLDWLHSYCPGLRDGDQIRRGMVHRLDKDTSGVMVCAKTHQDHEGISSQFNPLNRTVHRTYVALMAGRMSQPIKAQMNIIRDPNHRTRFTSVPHGAGKHSVSYFYPEDTFGSQYTLCRIELETGRTHQIRVHAEALGHGIIGDPVYNRQRPPNDLLVTRQLLHAFTLRFKHPRTQKEVSFKAPLPDDFADVLRSLKQSIKPG